MDASLIKKDYLALDKRDPVRLVQGWLLGDNPRRPVILDGKRPFAIVSRRAVLTQRTHDTTRLEKVLTPVPVVLQTDSPEAALEKMARAGVSYLPAADHFGRLAGYVDAQTLLRATTPGTRLTAKQLMGEAPPLFDDGIVEDAVQLFAKQRPDVLRVIDAKSQTVGVVNRATVIRLTQQTDLRMGRQDAAGNSTPLKRQRIRTIMENRILDLDAEASYDAVLDALDRDGHAFVKQGGQIVGVVTPLSALRAVARTAPKLAI